MIHDGIVRIPKIGQDANRRDELAVGSKPRRVSSTFSSPSGPHTGIPSRFAGRQPRSPSRHNPKVMNISSPQPLADTCQESIDLVAGLPLLQHPCLLQFGALLFAQLDLGHRDRTVARVCLVEGS